MLFSLFTPFQSDATQLISSINSICSTILSIVDENIIQIRKHFIYFVPPKFTSGKQKNTYHLYFIVSWEKKELGTVDTILITILKLLRCWTNDRNALAAMLYLQFVTSGNNKQNKKKKIGEHFSCIFIGKMFIAIGGSWFFFAIAFGFFQGNIRKNQVKSLKIHFQCSRSLRRIGFFFLFFSRIKNE